MEDDKNNLPECFNCSYKHVDLVAQYVYLGCCFFFTAEHLISQISHLCDGDMSEFFSQTKSRLQYGSTLTLMVFIKIIIMVCALGFSYQLLKFVVWKFLILHNLLSFVRSLELSFTLCLREYIVMNPISIICFVSFIICILLFPPFPLH